MPVPTNHPHTLPGLMELFLIPTSAYHQTNRLSRIVKVSGRVFDGKNGIITV